MFSHTHFFFKKKPPTLSLSCVIHTSTYIYIYIYSRIHAHTHTLNTHTFPPKRHRSIWQFLFLAEKRGVFITHTFFLKKNTNSLSLCVIHLNIYIYIQEYTYDMTHTHTHTFPQKDGMAISFLAEEGGFSHTLFFKTTNSLSLSV